MLVIWVLASAIGAGQADVLTTTQLQSGVRIQTGFLTFFTGGERSAEVTLTELGASGVTSVVRVIFYDDADQMIFKEEAVLQRGQPVHVRLPLDMPERRVRLRLSLTITGETGRKSVPIMVLESIDPVSFTIEERVFCAPPENKEGTTPYCPPPAMVSTFTTRG